MYILQITKIWACILYFKIFRVRNPRCLLELEHCSKKTHLNYYVKFSRDSRIEKNTFKFFLKKKLKLDL